eukprot:CAMPEP_0185024166 /NCGR_PEP_ID=MMETSP1103-20130426/7135_1 /TAXON_ID=36769 /ORGANISM="Paraphysomonas bandaiensis, Strain Caron Lab Isolate" /LENGTH=232 /DNA_ID=CAMNT_0027557059 /DNA_START=19 /DNA_END=717 /DNA_ORIENTATION=+
MISQFFESKRMACMGTVVFLTGLSMVFYIVGLSAWSNNSDTVLNTHWAYSLSGRDNDHITVIGLRSVFSFDLDNDDYQRTDLSDCDSDDDSCKNCMNAGETALGMCILAFFCCMLAAVFSIVRLFKFIDSALWRKVSISVFSLTLFWTIIAVSVFTNQCVNNLGVIVGYTITRYGPGYNCVTFNICWLLIGLVVHILTPAGGPKEKDDTLNDPLHVPAEEERGSEKDSSNQV